MSLRRLHGQLSFAEQVHCKYLSFGAASVEGRSAGGAEFSLKMLGLKNRVS